MKRGGAKIRLADLPLEMQDAARQQLREEAEAERVRFGEHCTERGIPPPIPEHRFHARKWRMDYAWPEQRVYLGVEGGVWTGGRHTRGAGFVKDMEKHNAAAVIGWRMLRVVPDALFGDETAEMIREALNTGERRLVS